LSHQPLPVNSIVYKVLKIYPKIKEFGTGMGFTRGTGEGTFWCDARFPQSILKLCRAGLDAKSYTFKREDGLRELGSRLTPASDGQPRQFVSKHCVNLISELLEYREDVKENDHAVDALRYSLPLEL